MFSGDVSGLRAEPSPPAALLPRGASAPSSSRLFSAQPSPVEVIKGEKKAMQGFVFLLCGRGWGAAYGIYYFALLLKQNAFAQTRPRKEPAHVARTLGPSRAGFRLRAWKTQLLARSGPNSPASDAKQGHKSSGRGTQKSASTKASPICDLFQK